MGSVADFDAAACVYDHWRRRARQRTAAAKIAVTALAGSGVA